MSKVLRKNAEKYKTFSCQIKKEIRKVEKNSNEDIIMIYLLTVQSLCDVLY